MPSLPLPPGAAETRQALRALLESFGSAVHDRNLDLVMELFTPGDDLLLAAPEAGEVARGRDEIERYFRRLFARPSRYAWVWTTFISGLDAERTAWLFAEGEVVRSGPDGERRHPYRVTGYVERTPAGWRWSVFHGAEPAHPVTPEP